MRLTNYKQNSMKKRFLFFALPLVAMLSLGSCGDDEIESENNTPNKEQTDPNQPSDGEEDDYDDDDEYTRMCEEKCTTFGQTNGVEYVDLGLPSGNLWATMNIGADKIEAYGDLYSWGETSTKDNYGEDYYSLYKKDETEVDGFTNYIKGYTKYVPKDKASEYGYGGFFDNKTTLDLTDDVAHVKLGGSWRMPTACDFDELLENCDKVWCTYQGVNGYKFTAKNGKWLFLPAAGYSDYYGRNDEGNGGYYWSSSLYFDYPYYANSLDFGSGSIYVGIGSRCYDGYSVRAVCPSAR